MSQSLANILVHLVFSTKGRTAWLTDDIRNELHAYIGGAVGNQRGVLLGAGSVADHIHLLIAHPRSCAPADLVQEVKIGSAKWLKSKSERFADFRWQGGYGMFSVSPGHRTAVADYLARQALHHQQITFEDEFRRLLQKYGIPFDERYLWD